MRATACSANKGDILLVTKNQLDIKEIIKGNKGMYVCMCVYEHNTTAIVYKGEVERRAVILFD